MQLDMFGQEVSAEWGGALGGVAVAPAVPRVGEVIRVDTAPEVLAPAVVVELLVSPASGRTVGAGCSWAALCQDVERLLACDHWDYDLTDVAFVATCVARGVLYRFGSPGGRAWRFIENVSLSVEDWLADEGVRFAQEHEGKRHRFSDEDLRAHWRCVLIQRARVQDCWEIYRAETAGEGEGFTTKDTKEEEGRVV